jgi:predicted nucleic acid-binding protein
MLAADTNIWIAFFRNDTGPDVQKLVDTIYKGEVYMPPPVLSEILSDPLFPEKNLDIITAAHLMKLDEQYWQRAGLMRSRLIKAGFKPRLPDTLIAQSCIDHNIPLLTRDSGFQIFSQNAGLKLV